MSKSKSKGAKGAVPAQDVLTKVKDAAITKPAQTVKAKSKEIAKQIASKEEKKGKLKKVKEPTPESSDAESDDADSEEAESGDESEESASSEGSDNEEEIKKPVKTGKVNGIASSVPKSSKKADSDSDSDSDSSDADSDESQSSRNQKTMNGVHKKAPAVQKAKAESSDEEDEEDSDDDSEAGVPAVKGAKGIKGSESSEDEEDDEEDESDSDDENEAEEAPAKNKGPVKAEELSKKLNPIAADISSDEDSDEGSDESAAESEDSGDELSDDEEDVKPVQPVKAKRKAEDVAVPAAKKSKTTEAGADNNQGGNLFVGNLSWNVDEEWLTREFEEFGELSGVRIITDRTTGRSKGFGYVEFVNAADAAKAHTAKKGALVDNRALNLDFANKRSNDGQQDRAQNRAKSFGDSTSPPSDTLFVGNLSFDAGQESVSEAFGEWGTVLGVRLPTDRDTGEPKGFGYVTFASVDEAKAALENMQGAEIAGRACRLDYSQPRPQNGESGGRGSFGGRGGGRGGFGGRGGGRGGFGDRGGRGGRGRGGFGDRGGRGGRGSSTNRGGFGDFAGKKVTF